MLPTDPPPPQSEDLPDLISPNLAGMQKFCAFLSVHFYLCFSNSIPFIEVVDIILLITLCPALFLLCFNYNATRKFFPYCLSKQSIRQAKAHLRKEPNSAQTSCMELILQINNAASSIMQYPCSISMYALSRRHSYVYIVVNILLNYFLVLKGDTKGKH